MKSDILIDLIDLTLETIGIYWKRKLKILKRTFISKYIKRKFFFHKNKTKFDKGRFYLSNFAQDICPPF